MVEVDSDIEDDFDVADFNYFDLDGDGSITMKELITKLNPSASSVEKEELAVIVSSAPNFDLDGNGNINIREMITKLNQERADFFKDFDQVPEPTLKKKENITLRETNPKLNPLAQGNLLRGIVNLSGVVLVHVC